MNTQPIRVQPGVPTGGQFAEKPHAESDLAIDGGRFAVDFGSLSDAEHNARGSFAYPPSARSAAQAIAFWRDVALPDTALEALSRSYWARTLVRERAVENAKSALIKATRKDRPAAEAARATAERELAGQNGLRSIPQNDLHELLRTAKLHWYSRVLPAEERAKVDTCQIIFNGGYRTTPGEAVRRFELDEFRNDLDGSDLHRRALERRESLRDRREEQMHHNIVTLIEQTGDNAHLSHLRNY